MMVSVISHLPIALPLADFRRENSQGVEKVKGKWGIPKMQPQEKERRGNGGDSDLLSFHCTRV